MIWSLLETLAIHKAHTFVVDEADMTLDMGFFDDGRQDCIQSSKEASVFGLLCYDSAKVTTLLEEIFV